VKRALFDIWEDESPVSLLPWCVQTANYVAHFPSMIQAELFVEATKKARKQDAKSVVKKSK
jgi:hypothetical protein